MQKPQPKPLPPLPPQSAPTTFIHPFVLLVPDAEHRKRVCAFSQRVNKTFNVKDAVKLYGSSIPVQKRWTRHLRMAAGPVSEGIGMLSVLSTDAYALKFICAPLMLLLKLVNAQDDMRLLWRWNAYIVLADNLVPISHPDIDSNCPMPSTSICRADLRVIDPNEPNGWHQLPDHAAFRAAGDEHECRVHNEIIVDMTASEKVVIRQYKSTDIVRVNIRGETIIVVMACGPTCGVDTIGLGYLSLVIAYACSSKAATLQDMVKKCVLADASNIIDTRKFDAVPVMSRRFVAEKADVCIDRCAPDVYALGSENDVVIMHSCNIASPAWYVMVEASADLSQVQKSKER